MTDKTIHKIGNQSTENPYEFVMSTESEDRHGDVVKQDWNLDHFKQNPVALFGHDPDFPIGTWENVRVVGKQLVGRLKLAAAGTSDRIDEIRSLVEQRILKAVSVGFRPSSAKPLDNKSGGLELSGNALMECSLVSIPANPDALITNKSLSDTQVEILNLAKSAECSSASCQLGVEKSRDSDVKPPLETKSETKESKKMNKLLSEKIVDKQDELNDLKNTLTETMELVDESVSEETEIQIKELTTQINKAESDLELLKSAESSLAMKAEKVEVKKSVDNEIAPRIEVKKVRQKGHNALASIATLFKAHANRLNPIDVAKAEFKDEPEIEMITRAAVDPATTTDAAWAAPLVRESWGEFMDLIRDISVYPSTPGMRLDFGRSGSIKVPMNDGRGQLAGAWVTEGAPIPVKEGSYATKTMAPKKLGVISTATKEIAMHSTPQIMQLIQGQILADTAEALDGFFLGDDAAAAGNPAGLQDPTATGAANIVASTGATVAAITTDATAALGRVLSARVGSGGAWIMNPLRRLGLRNKQDAASGQFVFRSEIASDVFMGYPVLISQNVPDDVVYFVSSDAIAYGNDYAPMIDVSDQATLHMEDTAPLEIVSATGPTTANPVRSLFQTDTIAIKMTLGLDWLVMKQGGVQVVTGVAW